MSDDNVVTLPIVRIERDDSGNPNVECDTCTTIDVLPSPEFAKLDLDALFNMRQWVQAALEAKGAKIVGAGIGCGGTMGIADIQIELEGHQCNIEIRPIS